MSQDPNNPDPGSANPVRVEAEEAEKKSGFAFLDWLPWETITIWALFLGAVYVLRSFFLIVFMTFIVAYSMRGMVVRLARLILPRRESVWLERGLSLICFATLIFVIGVAGRFIGPELYDQGKKLVARVQTLVENPQEKLDEVLGETVGRYLVNEKYGQPGDEAYEEALTKYQGEGLQYGQYTEFGRQLSKLEEVFRKHEFEQRTSRLEQAIANPLALNEILKRYVLDNESEMVEVRRGAETVYEKNRKKALLDNPLSKDVPFPELSEQQKRTYVETYYVEKQILAVKPVRDEYTKRWKADWVQAERDEILRLKVSNRAEFDALFVAFYEQEPEPDAEGEKERKPYETAKFLELRDAYELEDRKESVRRFSALVGGTPPSAESEDEREERERKEFVDWLRAKELDSWKSGDFAKQLGTKFTGFVGDGLSSFATNIAAMVQRMFTLPVELALSFLLSLFIVFDVHRLKKGVRRLEGSRLKNFYAEIAPSLISFGRLIGRAFQAQAVIALFNTILTFFAIRLLGIQNEAFLCSIVFVCSFIPVLGVALSSVPIGVMAIVQDGGSVLLATWAIVAILGIHFIETSILNPKILGDMLHLHPVLVLAILAVSEHFFGIWGLLLGVPVIVYIIRFVILDEGIPGFIEPTRKGKLARSSARSANVEPLPIHSAKQDDAPQSSATGKPGGTSEGAEESDSRKSLQP